MHVTKYDVQKGNDTFAIQFNLQSNSSTHIDFVHPPIAEKGFIY
jgi:hypothetical protein